MKCVQSLFLAARPWERELGDKMCLFTDSLTCCITVEEELKSNVEHLGYHTAPSVSSRGLKTSQDGCLGIHTYRLCWKLLQVQSDCKANYCLLSILFCGGFKFSNQTYNKFLAYAEYKQAGPLLRNRSRASLVCSKCLPYCQNKPLPEQLGL